MPPDGYAWWYLDAISDDGTRALSVIAFIGSVFSPWYRWSGRRAPDNHVCMNVATYGPGGRFAMTDRGRAALHRGESHITIGPSTMSWDGSRVTVEVDERASPPLPGRLKGRVTLTPQAVTEAELPLTPDGAHVWRPFAPSARVEVDLGRRGQWNGHGYLDANFGTRALEADFSYWTWGRYPLSNGTFLAYDATLRDGTRTSHAFHADAGGTIAPLPDAPPLTPMSRSLWQVRRETRADPGTRPTDALRMLDAPFYSRSAVTTRLNGETTTGVHEALDLSRFRGPWLMPMLAVRVPRWTGRAPKA